MGKLEYGRTEDTERERELLLGTYTYLVGRPRHRNPRRMLHVEPVNWGPSRKPLSASRTLRDRSSRRYRKQDRSETLDMFQGKRSHRPRSVHRSRKLRPYKVLQNIFVCAK